MVSVRVASPSQVHNLGRSAVSHNTPPCALKCIGAFVLLLCLAGCASWPMYDGVRNAFGKPPVVPPADYGNLGWWATILIGVGAVALVASFVFPLIPKSAPAASIGVGVGLLVLKAALVAFMPYLKWAALALLIWFGWTQYKRFMLDRKGKHLARNGNRDAGGAMMALARGWTAMKDTPLLGARHHQKRKALLAKVAPIAGAGA